MSLATLDICGQLCWFKLKVLNYVEKAYMFPDTHYVRHNSKYVFNCLGSLLKTDICSAQVQPETVSCPAAEKSKYKGIIISY